MSTMLTTETNNAYLNALKNVLHEATTPIQWLVICHKDPQLFRSLSKSFSNERVAFLQVSQDTWNFRDEEFAEAIEWALDQAGITNVVLAGTSQASGGGVSVSLVKPAVNETESSYAKLLAGVEAQNQRNSDAADWFASQAKQMLEIPSVQDRWSGDKLQVHGLLYRVESGLFLAFDFDTKQFRPLMAN